MTLSSCTNRPSANPASSLHGDAGRAEAFDRCARGLYRYIVVRLGNDTHLADDMMQQVWLQARTSKTNVPPAEFEFYLRKIATNLVRAHWRREGRRPAHVPVADPDIAAVLAEQLVSHVLPTDVLTRKETSDQLLLAITAMGSEDQTLIIGHYFQGLSHGSLARWLDTSERAIEGRLYRARQALRNRLRGVDDVNEVTR